MPNPAAGGNPPSQNFTHPNVAVPGLRADLEAITKRFEAADRRAKQAVSLLDREAAEAQRREAEGDFWAAGMQVADLFLLLLRYGIRHRPEALRLYLAELLRPELAPIVEALARLEARP